MSLRCASSARFVYNHMRGCRGSRQGQTEKNKSQSTCHAQGVSHETVLNFIVHDQVSGYSRRGFDVTSSEISSD